MDAAAGDSSTTDQGSAALLCSVREWANKQTGKKKHQPWPMYKLYQIGEAADDLLEMFPNDAAFESVPFRNERNATKGD